MLAIFSFILFSIFNPSNGQVTEEVNTRTLLKLCDICVCSEIPNFDGSDLVLNIQCSELDRIQTMTDLYKIEWPENANGLKIRAAFEGLGIATLGKLPPNLKVETLGFSNNAIKTYWPDPFQDIPNLKKLSFSQNDLTEVTPDLFTNIEALEDLDISYNKLTDFNPIDFKYLSHLKRFNLQSNNLKKIPLEALQEMHSLEDLDLSKNGIYDLVLYKNENDKLKSLTRLNLSGNRIRSVTAYSFPANNTIELLDLSNNIIEVVEEESFLTCTSLRELDLGQNNITFVFALPPTLEIAVLKMNTLYHWPNFPSGITYIDLAYNRLTDFYDENKVDFDKLEVLNIEGNQIKEINIDKKLPKLFTLDLSYNLIPEIPKTINAQILPNLEELRLDGNPIQTIYFKNILALKSLYLNDLSKLEIVEDKAFSNVLSLNGEDEKSCFSLYLSNCPSLKEIRDGAFAATNLCMLDISKNNLTSLSKSLLDWPSLTEGVNLQFNPWTCTCDLQWVLDDLLPSLYKSNVRMLAELRCASPRAYEGLRLVHFYNWTEKAMCSENFMKAGPHNTYILESSTAQNSEPEITSLTLILGAGVIVGVLIIIALMVYLVKTRRRYRVRQAALKRKRQSATDARNSNGIQKEQFSALNKA